MKRFTRPGLGAFCLLGLGLSGCDLFSVRNFVSRPDSLSPESDAFVDSSQRFYTWKEGSRVNSADSQTIRTVTLQVLDRGEIPVNGTPGRKLDVLARDGSVLPASVLSDLGFSASRVSFDTAAIPDPGADLGYPEHPDLGWRVEEKVGDLQWVRELQGLDTLETAMGLVEAWRFSDTAYWTDGADAGKTQALQTVSLWMGRTGMLRCHVEWPGNGGTPGFWREVMPQ